VSWVRLFDSSISTLTELSDGQQFAKILSKIDASWFRVSALCQNSESNASWVFKFNHLKKMHKLMLSFLDNQLNVKPNLHINLNAIAKDNSVPDLVSFATLVLCIAVQCDNNAHYIKDIQTLDNKTQQQLMLAIDNTISSKNSALLSPVESIGELRKEVETLQKANADLSATNFQLLSQGGSGAGDFLLKQEISNLRETIQKTQDKLSETQTIAEKQESQIQDLTRSAQESAQTIRETSHLKDQLDEFRHLADKLQKTEALNEKYKKKLDEGMDMKKRVKALEDENLSLRSQQTDIENEYKKMKAYKPLLDSYKDQVKQLGDQNSVLMIEGSRAEFERREYQVKLERLEQEKKAASELNNNLEDRLREIELAGGDLISGETLAGELDGRSDSEDSSSQLRYKVVQLERQLEKFKGSASENSEQRILLLENLLVDSNRLKSKFEDDYLVLYQRNLGLENEVKQMSSDSGSRALQIELEEKEQEISTLRQRLSTGGSAVSTDSALSADLSKARQQLEHAQSQLRISEAKINKLSAEKENLVESAIDLKNRLTTESKNSSEMRAILASLESGKDETEEGAVLANTTQHLVKMQQQNEALHHALKQAKDRIQSFEKMIKESSSKDTNSKAYVEAMAAYEAAIREKDLEISRITDELKSMRIAVAREQRLMAAAYHSLGMQTQKAMGGAGNIKGTWLANQRKKQEFSVRGN